MRPESLLPMDRQLVRTGFALTNCAPIRVWRALDAPGLDDLGRHGLQSREGPSKGRAVMPDRDCATKARRGSVSVAASPHDEQASPPLQSELPWPAVSRSLRETLAGEAIVQVLRFAGLIVLARALEPRNFGAFKILVVVGMVAVVLNEAGIPDALIQRPRIDAEHESTAWWINLAVSVTTCLLLYFSALKIAHVMAMPELSFATRLICIPLLLEGITSTAGARLRRALRFDLLVLADVLCEVAFLGVALVLWYRGSGEWCLPGALAARYATHALVTQWSSGYVPTSLPRHQAAKELAPFSAAVLGGRLVTLASSNADYILVGRLLGSSALGLYSIAWDMLRLVPDRVYRIVGRVAFPAFCQLREPQALGGAYANIVESIGRLVLPTTACLAVVAPHLFATMYGVKWVTAAQPLRLLAAGLGLSGTRVAIGAVYYATGRPHIDMYLHGLRLVAIAMAVALSASAGLPAVCVSVSIVEALVTVGGQWLAGSAAKISPLRLCKAYIPGCRTALLCGLAAEAGMLISMTAGLPETAELPAAVLLAATVFIFLEFSDLLRNMQSGFAPAAVEMREVSH
jgi:O-antigen/teichoic acid export membrane protein